MTDTTPRPHQQRSTNFLDLPPELRQAIYSHYLSDTIPLLAPFPLLDPEWTLNRPTYTINNHPSTSQPISSSSLAFTSPHPSTATTHTRSFPSLAFVHPQIAPEVLPQIYSRAILEVAPPQSTNTATLYFTIRHTPTARTTSYASSQLRAAFERYPAAHLARIRTVHIYSNQPDVVDSECYETLLRWILTHTDVRDIRVTTRVMTRVREQASFDRAVFESGFGALVSSALAGGAERAERRVVRVWSNKRRPAWEYDKMMRLRCKLGDCTLPAVQVYFYVGRRDGRGEGSLMLDPRWSVKVTDAEERWRETESVVPRIQALVGTVLTGREWEDYKACARHFVEEDWVYQMIVLAETSSQAASNSD